MAASPDAATQSMINNLPDKTGKSLTEWHKVLGMASLEKHGEMVKLLKGDHGVGHGFANLIVHEYRNAASGGAQGEGALVDAQYTGAKADLRSVYDAIIRQVTSFGSDVEVSPKKTYVSLRRSKQFALIQPSTKTRVDVGINLKGEKAGGRLENSGSFNAMVSHRVRITDKKEVDSVLKSWLRKAYDAA
jgi:predicted transport protein